MSATKSTNVYIVTGSKDTLQLIHADHCSFVQILSRAAGFQMGPFHKLLPIMITSFGKPSILATSKQPSLP